MVPTRRITFKLCPDRQQQATLHYWQKLHCALYNADLDNRKTQYQKFGHSVDYWEQQNSLPNFKEVWTEYKPLGSHALPATLKRFVGIDLGCKDAMTLSTGEKIPNPDFIKEGQRKVKSASKGLCRKRSPNRNKKIKASRQWKKARQRVSKLQRKVARQRLDWLHKVTSGIVTSHSLVTGEQLNVKAMTGQAKKGKRKAQKAGLNRSMLEVGFGMIGQMFEYKLAEAGGFYLESPTRTLKPSQRSAKCWELTPKTLADRVHICSNLKCNPTDDRDVNAAQVNVIWARGRKLSSPGAESSSSTSCGSMRQLGAKKRQKRRSATEASVSVSRMAGNSDLSPSRLE